MQPSQQILVSGLATVSVVEDAGDMGPLMDGYREGGGVRGGGRVRTSACRWMYVRGQ